MEGDKVKIVVDASGDTRTYQVEATQAGRRIDEAHGRGRVEVTEVTPGGTPVRSARLMAARVIAPIEHPSRRVLRGRRDGAPIASQRLTPRPVAPGQGTEPVPTRLA